MTESPLRDLARKIEQVAREHPCWSQVHQHVYCLTDYINARAFIEEFRSVEAKLHKETRPLT